MTGSKKVLIEAIIIFACFLPLFKLCSATASSDSSLSSGFMDNVNMADEGDSHHRTTRSLRMQKTWVRSGYGVVFVYSNNFNVYELQKIKMAAAEIRRHSCYPITLVSQPSFFSDSYRKYPHYVFMDKSRAVGCGQADVGMRGGYQSLTLSPDARCFTVGTIMHEMLHALGIEHEQSRPDRNKFIQINNPNVQYGLQNVFNIAYGSTAYGPYDFDSVMHYGRYAFSSYPNMPTLSSKVAGHYVPPKMNEQLSYWDKRKINVITGCKVNSRRRR